MCVEDGDPIASRAERLSREAVSHVFTTLCGKSDADDKFTGMQREMNLYIKRTIQTAIEAGQEAGKRELAREQYRSSKAMEQLQASFKAKAKENEDRRVAELVARVDRMCNALGAQKQEFEQNLKEFERASKIMSERAALHEKQGKDWAAQMAALKRQADEARAEAESAQREADRERRAAAVLQDKVDDLERRLADEAAATKAVSARWSNDVELMQTQLQTEVEARIAAEQRLLEANDARSRSARDETMATASSKAGATAETEMCKKCEAREELTAELQAAVALLNDQLSSVYREKATAEKEREREHAKAIAAVRDEMAAQLTAARDAQAFAEKVAKRLENELLKQSQAIVQQQQAGRQQAPGLKRRMGGGKQHTEFKDFSADIDRLTGGGKTKAPPGASQGLHTPREPAEQDSAHTQLPAMLPVHASAGSFRPPSCRPGVGGAGVGGPGVGGEVRLGEIRKPTPPIGASGANRGRGGKACPSLNLAEVERQGGPGGVAAAEGTAATERAGGLGTARRDLSRGARHLLASRGSYSAR